MRDSYFWRDVLARPSASANKDLSLDLTLKTKPLHFAIHLPSFIYTKSLPGKVALSFSHPNFSSKFCKSSLKISLTFHERLATQFVDLL